MTERLDHRIYSRQTSCCINNYTALIITEVISQLEGIGRESNHYVVGITDTQLVHPFDDAANLVGLVGIVGFYVDAHVADLNQRREFQVKFQTLVHERSRVQKSTGESSSTGVSNLYDLIGVVLGVSSCFQVDPIFHQS